MEQPDAEMLASEKDAEDLTIDALTLKPVDAVSEKLHDALTPGYQVEFDPDEAESAGAFFENALSEDDALASAHDSAPYTPHS